MMQILLTYYKQELNFAILLKSQFHQMHIHIYIYDFSGQRDNQVGPSSVPSTCTVLHYSLTFHVVCVLLHRTPKVVWRWPPSASTGERTFLSTSWQQLTHMHVSRNYHLCVCLVWPGHSLVSQASPPF